MRYIQFQAFIGPWIGDWDYSAYRLGDSDNLFTDSAVATDLISGVTSLWCTRATPGSLDWPAGGGGLWVGGNGAGQGWEYVSYASTTDTGSFVIALNLTREATALRDHNGLHTLGAEVHFWYPVENDLGKLEFSQELVENYRLTRWSLSLPGVNLPSSLLRNNHIVAVRYRTSPIGTWNLLWLGISDAYRIKTDYRAFGEWSLHVVSPASWLENKTAHGIQVGDLDVAEFGTPFSSSPLGSSFKQLLSGDYVAAEPVFEPESAFDDDRDSLWISDYVVGTTVTADASWEGVTQMYLNPHLGRGPAYKWIELYNFSTEATKLVVWDTDTDTEHQLDFQDYSPGVDYWIILTDDPVTFERENPGHRADVIVNVREIAGYSDFMDHAKPAGGAIGIKNLGGNITFYMRWGDQSVDPGSWTITSTWTGAAVPAPDYGETIYFKHEYTLGPSEDSKNKWQLTDFSNPGYLPENSGDKAWLATFLPGLGLSLRDDITAVDTVLYIVDASGEPSTEGLPSSGTIQIGVEQMTVTAKDMVSITVSSVTGNHSSGDLIYVVENGVATDGFPIKSIKWYRYNGTIYPADFRVRYSRVISRLPNQTEHEDDYGSPYGAVTTVTAHAASSYTLTLGSTMRLRTLLMEFNKMTSDPHYARVNKIEAVVDTATFSGSYYKTVPQDPTSLMSSLLQLGDVYSGSITVANLTDIQKRFRTARDSVWATLMDLAEMMGVFVDIDWDSHITLSADTLFTTAAGAFANDYVWDEDDIVSVERVNRVGANVGQVKLAWESHDGSESGSVAYPSTFVASRSIMEVEEQIHANAAAAMVAAQRYYILERAPYYWVIELYDPNLNIRCGEIARVGWQFPGEGVSIARQVLIVGVDLRVGDNAVKMVVTAMQVDREADW